MSVRVVGVMAVFAGSIFAQPPAISQNGVVNAASRIPPTLPGAAIARGARFSISGVRLSSPHRTTSVTLTPGGAVKVIAASANRVDALMPADAALGRASLTVSVDGESSKPFAIRVVASNPGIFSRNGEGWGPGVIENLGTGGRAENSDVNPARRGGRIALRVTGLGEEHVEVMIGGRRALGVMRAADRPGEQEVIAAIPRGAPEGCSVPVYLSAARDRASNVVTVAIGAAPCVSAPLPKLSRGRLGIGLFSRTQFRATRQSSDSILDEAIVSFAATDGHSQQAPPLLLPPAGTCTGHTGSMQSSTVLPNSISAALVAELGARGLDAGKELRVDRGSEAREIPEVRGATGFYRIRLGSRDAPFGPWKRGPFLDPGEYRLTAPGGKDVGRIAERFPGPTPLQWTNRDQISIVDRARPLTVRWSDAAPASFVIILATNIDQLTTAAGTCLCVARAEAGTFTIPAALLANLPVSRDIPGIPYDQLFVASLPRSASPMAASGLDAGAILSLYAVGRNVEYR